jgi:hypothetical protein
VVKAASRKGKGKGKGKGKEEKISPTQKKENS